MTEKILKGFGIDMASDLVRQPCVGKLMALFSKTAFDFFVRAGLGLGSTEAAPKEDEHGHGRKGISCERSFKRLEGSKQLEQKLNEIASTLSGQMAEEKLRAKHVTLKMKSIDFQIKTRCKLLPAYIKDADAIAQVAINLLKSQQVPPLRLIGIRMASFEPRVTAPLSGPTIDKYLSRADGSDGIAITKDDLLLHEEDAAAGNVDEVGPSSSVAAKFTCPKCNRLVPEDQRVEHGDWHLAHEMHRDEVEVLRLSPPSKKGQQQRAKKKAKKNPSTHMGMHTISSLFNPK